MSSKITDVNRQRRAARVQKVRADKGLTQREIAEALGLSLRGYQTYERGETDISTDLTEALLRTYRVSPLWLISGEGNMYLSQGGACPEHAQENPVAYDNRLVALGTMLAQLPPEDREAILTHAFARASDRKQLADLQRAIADLQLKVSG